MSLGTRLVKSVPESSRFIYMYVACIHTVNVKITYPLCMHTGRKNTVPSSIDDNSVDSPHVKAELTSHQYKVRCGVYV